MRAGWQKFLTGRRFLAYDVIYMRVDMQLYAYMTFIFENMTKQSKNKGKNHFFHQKSDENDISKFDMLICWSIKNHEKMMLS